VIIQFFVCRTKNAGEKILQSKLFPAFLAAFSANLSIKGCSALRRHFFPTFAAYCPEKFGPRSLATFLPPFLPASCLLIFLFPAVTAKYVHLQKNAIK